MSLSAFFKRATPQICVYWGSPINDGKGGFTFAEPVELACRWEASNQIVTDKNGSELTSRAVAYLLQDVDEDGMLYLGHLDDFMDSEDSSGDFDIPHPKSIDGAYYIKRFVKTPNVSGKEYLRAAYLTPSLSFGGF
jgi:hypothetical protein